MVLRPQTTVGSIPGGFSLNYEAHRDITHYYQHLGPPAPIHSLERGARRQRAESQQALKFGNGTHASSAAIDVSPNSARLESPTAPASSAGRPPRTRRSTT